MRRVVGGLALLACLVMIAEAAQGTTIRKDPLGCTGTPNMYPIWDEQPTLLKEVPQGRLYRVDSVSPPILVTHLWGSAYQMGYAHGQLLKEPILSLYAQTTAYFERQAEKYFDQLPAWLAEILAQLGLGTVLHRSCLASRRVVSFRCGWDCQQCLPFCFLVIVSSRGCFRFDIYVDARLYPAAIQG